jgi:hypothetical protein
MAGRELATTEGRPQERGHDMQTSPVYQHRHAAPTDVVDASTNELETVPC